MVETFTDDAGVARPYPIDGLAEDEKARYRDWWNGVVAANAHNHDKPITLEGSRDYDALRRETG